MSGRSAMGSKRAWYFSRRRNEVVAESGQGFEVQSGVPLRTLEGGDDGFGRRLRRTPAEWPHGRIQDIHPRLNRGQVTQGRDSAGAVAVQADRADGRLFSGR